MQALQDLSDGRGRGWPWHAMAVGAVLVLLVAGGVVYAVTRTGGGPAASVSCGRGLVCGSHGAGSGSGGASGTSTTSKGTAPFDVVSTTPADGATGAPSNTSLTVKFSGPVTLSGATPTISPSITGTWSLQGPDTLVFTPTAPFVPFTNYTLTVASGPTGTRSTSGAHLVKTETASFTIANGSTLRLQQLLAELDYLPLNYTPPSVVPPQDMALAQSGTLVWKWPGTPVSLMALWAQGNPNTITKGAVMSFQQQNHLTVDGVPGPKVWATLLAAAAAKNVDGVAYTYVLVTKTLPQHLTAWVNGTLKFTGVPVNTGVPGATTTDGAYQVFEHVKASDMKGTNVTGSTYTDPTVPWASYFNGGDALHGFPHATYGWPQSNGCVEMKITTAGALWPYTGIGTVVSVQGPPA